MFHIPKSAYSFATSSIREFIAPTNEAAEVPQPLPVAQQLDLFTGDYFRDDMAVLGVSYLSRVRVSSATDPAIRSRALFSVFLNVSSSPARGSSNPCFLMKRKRAKTRVKMRSPCLI